jgi:ABC-type nitrate/sulfonate/bicarbonate transport system substrate-binding protein
LNRWNLDNTSSGRTLAIENQPQCRRRDGALKQETVMTIKRRMSFVAGLAAVMAASGIAHAQETKVSIGISGWTGFAPLTLAREAGIFKKNGLDVTIKKIPQASRHLAIQSGDIQCAATTVETWIVWNANGVATRQLFQLDKSYGADGMAVRNTIASIKDLKGKKVAASAPGLTLRSPGSSSRMACPSRT